MGRRAVAFAAALVCRGSAVLEALPVVRTAALPESFWACSLSSRGDRTGYSGEHMSEDHRNTSALGRETISTSELKIQLCRNPVDQNWSVAINNERYRSITFESVKRLVAQAL